MSIAAERLLDSRVDLIDLIANGLPEREYVPGTNGALPVGKRLHITAERKTGKSLAVGVVLALRIVKAGGSVSILDRENGADEYARRVEAVLTAWDATDEFREHVRRQYGYYDFPSLELSWASDASYAATFEHDDVVIFDSSRSHLTPLGLAENSSDDYAAFASALVDPLMRAGKTTVILDNSGHDSGRSRGTSSKGDLCDVIYSLKKTTPFNVEQRGTVELSVEASRIGEMFGSWTMNLGGGEFGQFTRQTEAASAAPKLENVKQQILDLLSYERLGALNRADVARGLERGSADGTVGRALTQLVGEGKLTEEDKKYELTT